MGNFTLFTTEYKVISAKENESAYSLKSDTFVRK